VRLWTDSIRINFCSVFCHCTVNQVG